MIPCIVYQSIKQIYEKNCCNSIKEQTFLGKFIKKKVLDKYVIVWMFLNL